MNNLNQEQSSLVNGGNAAYIAISVGISTYVGAATIISATQTLNQFGHTVGEQVFTATHPEPLGQMIYPVEIPTNPEVK